MKGKSEGTLLQAGCPKSECRLLLVAKIGVMSIETNLALEAVSCCWILELQDKFMTSLLPSVLYEFGSQAPSLSKDFHYLVITTTEVRHWLG